MFKNQFYFVFNGSRNKSHSNNKRSFKIHEVIVENRSLPAWPITIVFVSISVDIFVASTNKIVIKVHTRLHQPQLHPLVSSIWHSEKQCHHFVYTICKVVGEEQK